MIHLVMEFPAGQYHATPWGSHVNEGLVEWPPSPWRILRAMLAAGYTTLHWPGDGPPQTARSLIEKLSTVKPTYTLPETVGTHSRHYMPLARLKKGREDTTLVFDTWLRVKEKLLVHWDVALTEAELNMLGEIVERIGYLGRSESWVNMRVGREEPGRQMNCWPEELGMPHSDGLHWEQVSLFAPASVSEYGEWRTSYLEAAATSKQEHGKRHPASPPDDLIACLQMQTSDLKRSGWSRPPGSQRVFYWRKINSVTTSPVRAAKPKNAVPSVSALLLSATTLTGNNHALPHIARTLPQADILHRALVSVDHRLHGKPGVILRGKDDDHKPLRSPHTHAHILPLDLDGDDHIDHFLIYAPMGLDANTQAAIRAVRKTFTKGGVAPLKLAVAASGSIADIGDLPSIYGATLKRITGKRLGNKHWSSLTPFVPPLFLKKQGRNTLEGQIRKELTNRGFPEPEQVRFVDPHEPEARKQRHFIRRRRSSQQPPQDVGFTVELSFASPVYGPIALGYGSHFGLGLFAAID